MRPEPGATWSVLMRVLRADGSAKASASAAPLLDPAAVACMMSACPASATRHDPTPRPAPGPAGRRGARRPGPARPRRLAPAAAVHRGRTLGLRAHRALRRGGVAVHGL